MKEINNIRTIKRNFVEMISDEWMLITAGTERNFNTMTASWGGFGHLWNKDIVYIYIRPQRFTYEFAEQNDVYSINFFDEKYRDLLRLLGTKSGRDIDKMNLEITPVFENGNVYYKEANLAVLCKKIYYQDIDSSNFLDDKIQKNYPKKDYHRMYIGEIYKIIENK